MKKIEIFLKIWKNISYNSWKNIYKINIDIYIQIKDSEFKKTDKLLFWRKKMTLIKFQNSIIYWLYNWEMNLIVISINVNINKKLNFIEMKNLLINQLFFEFSVTISTFNFLAMRIILTKSALIILHCFSCKAVKIMFKNINLSNSINFISQSVRMISDSDFQAVKVVSSAYKSCNWS